MLIFSCLSSPLLSPTYADHGIKSCIFLKLIDLEPTMTTLRTEIDHALLELLRWTDVACYHTREFQTLVQRRFATLALPDWLSSRYPGLAVRVLIGYGLLSLLVEALFSRAPPKQNHQPSIAPLAALLRLFVPRTSIWPCILISVTNDAKRRARETGKRVICLRLDTILSLLEDGSISLRNPRRDARSLVMGKDHFGGWDIEFIISPRRWWWTYAVWWLGVTFKTLLSPPVVSSIINSCHVLISYQLDPFASTYDLDTIPLSRVPALLEMIDCSVPRRHFVFTFSSYNGRNTAGFPPLAVLLPSLISKQPSKLKTISLLEWLAYLTTGKSHFTVLSVQDSSREYAVYLHREAGNLPEWDRVTCVLRHWEAGIYDAGICTRWTVVAIRAEKRG